ncbi:MAG: acyl-CoA dehydrogenase family protein [Pseudomonadales bacterium]|nr:acyl-CoA dehydrogenase family protein [Pseudomonadales bacterium]MEE2890592.1 acyl-CoA dehydrogenase family protein [Pseudomonadota bacterium]
MDFSLSDEQSMLKDSIEKFVQNDYDFDTRRKIMANDEGFSRELWSQMAELGWLAVPFAEEDGGFGGGAIELMLVMEQIGRGLIVEPYMATVVLAGGFLKRAGSAEQKEKYLSGVIDGSKLGAFAFAEPQGRFNLADLTTTAAADGDGYVLNGHKAVVLNGPSADFLVVSARTSGEQRDEAGVSVFVLDADTAGVSRRDYPTVDGLRAAEITLENVRVGADALIGEAGQALPLIQEVIDEATLAVGCEAVGNMEVAYKSTVDYSKQRVQFGQPIGKFQVLQHRMVDMFMEYEQAKSLMYMAAMRMDEGYGAVAQKAVSAFKVQVGKSGRYVGQQAVQVHGGMGMTEELHIGHYFKRLTMIDTLFGNVDFHLRRYGSIAA